MTAVSMRLLACCRSPAKSGGGGVCGGGGALMMISSQAQRARRWSSSTSSSGSSGGGAVGGATASSSSSSNFLRKQFSLEGRSGIVTGGGTGIGRALALGLARAGAAVVLTGRRQSVLEEAAARINRAVWLEENNDSGADGGGANQQQQPRAFCVAGDVTDYTATADLVREAEFLTGIPPTILINNAGINVRQPADQLTSEHWQRSLDLMLTAPFVLARALSPNMLRQEHGRIVNLASLQSAQAFPDSIPYAAAKSGVLGLTRALAEAYSEPHGYADCTCNALAPGYVETELTRSVFADADRRHQLAAATIAGRNSVPDDLVGACLFLCSPSASYVTGQTLHVDGGFSALGMR